MRQQRDTRSQRVFVAEGDKVVERLLVSQIQVVSVLLPVNREAEFAPLIAARPEPIHLFVAEFATLEQLTGFNLYQGVLAVGRVPDSCDLAGLLRQTAPPRLLVAADGLSNADNLGGLIRNAVAFGTQGLVLGETCIHPYMRRSVRISMGTIFKLPVLESSCLAGALRALRDAGVRCVAAHPYAAMLLSSASLLGDCCLVFGSEGQGLRPEVLAACHEPVAVPMANDVDSLNVMNASAVFLYEAARQRAAARG
jgi:tRNA G18 (ribose-2'-O)-methylase SpoU